MFKKLRNRFITITLSITTVILLISFSFIYYFASSASKNRPPIPEDAPNYTATVENILFEHIAKEKQDSLNSLLNSLIISGISIEIIVAVAAFWFAEDSIKPVKEAYELQKTFIANASHEIKTPLAAISANLEAADIKGNHWINNVSKEAAKLTELNNQLLALARADNVTSTQIEEINLQKTIKEALVSFDSRIKKKKIVLNATYAKDSKIKINRADYLQVVNILIDNAIKYCNKKITIKTDNKSFVIKNDGATIDADKISHIFDRFYQTDKSAEGVGLGLSIAKTVADKNHWQLLAASDSKSTTFELKY